VRQADEGGRKSTSYALDSLFSRLAIYENARLGSIQCTASIEEAEAKLLKVRCETEEALRAHFLKYPYLCTGKEESTGIERTWSASPRSAAEQQKSKAFSFSRARKNRPLTQAQS
jgi:hypothetical protein